LYKNYITRFLKDEYNFKKSDSTGKDLNIVISQRKANIPKQKNAYDCGVYVCKYIEFFLCASKEMDFDKGGIVKLRRDIILKLYSYIQDLIAIGKGTKEKLVETEESDTGEVL